MENNGLILILYLIEYNKEYILLKNKTYPGAGDWRRTSPRSTPRPVTAYYIVQVFEKMLARWKHCLAEGPAQHREAQLYARFIARSGRFSIDV